jgi:AcrR family transcriptional regulator
MSPERRREQLLDVVLELICIDGVGAVNIDAVARRADVTRPVVYNHFTDSDDMLRACLDREEQRALAQLADAVPGPGTENLVSAFHHLFDTYLRAVVDAPQRWRAVFQIADSGTHALQLRVERGRARFAREFESALRHSPGAGQFDDPALLAHHLLALMWESGRLRLVSPDEFGHDRLLRSLDALLTALTADRRKDNDR